MNRKETVILEIVAFFAAALLLVGGERLFYNGPLSEAALRPEYGRMMAELLLFFAWVLYFWAGEREARIRVVGILSAVFVFTWQHQVFTALAVSGLYLLYLLALGRLFLRILYRKRWQPLTPGIVCASFLVGGSLWIALVCLLSAFRMGGIRQLQIFAAATAVPVLMVELGTLWKRQYLVLKPDSPSLEAKGHWRRYLFPLIIAMLALQAGRMNVALDYDSLHYGLRSAYILDNGAGIYENLGNINLVYTYSKGLETLVLPLCLRTSHSFVLAFNLWITAGVLWMVSVLASKAGGKSCGLLAAAVVSCIPGIMNMSITAKSDSITLLFQLILLYFMICFLDGKRDGERVRFLILAVGACLFTYILKPTSLVFSTAVMGMSLFYVIVKRLWKMKWGSLWWITLLPVLASWAGIWYRTFLLTGVPATSVFTSIFRVLGFRVKWPFAFGTIPDNGTSDSLAERMSFLGSRLFHMLAAPVGEDMDHVIIAWGTGVTGVLFAAAVLLGITRWRKTKNPTSMGYLWTVFLPFTLVCLISIRRLWQVDGNYFMLFYAMTAIIGIASVNRAGVRPFGRGMAWILAPMLLFNVAVTGLTNWSGYIGFSPSRLLHRGYYNHLEENRTRQAIKGNAEIWDILASNPRTRVLAMGDHPDVLSFPCNIQSYYDLTGSGGNVRLVKTLHDFKAFLGWAGIQYLYIQAGYLEEGSRAMDIVRYMIEDGSLAEIRYEHGNVIAAINLDGELPVTPEKSLAEFFSSCRFSENE